MNDAAYEAFKREVLGGEINHGLSEAGDGDRSSEPEFEAGRPFFGAGDMAKLAAEPDAPLSEDAQIKDELRQQQHAEKFEAPDSTDTMTDGVLWEATPKNWRKDG